MTKQRAAPNAPGGRGRQERLDGQALRGLGDPDDVEDKDDQGLRDEEEREHLGIEVDLQLAQDGDDRDGDQGADPPRHMQTERNCSNADEAANP